MPANGTAFLVMRRDDGFGDVVSLAAADRYTLGRAATNRIVLKDELCSREHAEVFRADGHWRVRDLSSLNGTRVNGERLTGEFDLAPGDEIHLGKSTFLFVEDMSQLPDVPTEPFRPPAGEGEVSIKKRLGQTRLPDASAAGQRLLRHRLGGGVAP